MHGHVCPDAFERGVSQFATQQVAHSGDACFTAFRDHIGGPELTCQSGAVRVAMASHAPNCAGVGAAKDASSQAWVAGENFMRSAYA
ncbi:hypothetical protein GCM10010407_05640 [Rarobacter incanus]